MRKAMALAAGLMLVATSAWSQGSSSRYGDGPSTRRGDDRGDYDRHDKDWDRRDGSDRDFGSRPGAGRSAFSIRVGDSRLAVRCGEGESLRACVDAASTLFDKVRSEAAQPAQGSGPPR